ncbi:MAG: hydratase [Oscillospiraceae bacterium]|jgi:aconitate hydratase|nr:hydratase [Oscillospiraceae bacterium]
MAVQLTGPAQYRDNALLPPGEINDVQAARKKTIARRILDAHDTKPGLDTHLLRFDAMASHDITYVGIIQSARASGLTRFPLPYVLTNCHNSLCAVGGTINEDDHMFGLSAAKKYGGEFVPAHQAVIHQYMRERYAAPGRMILASDSHTRYGAYGTLGIGEGGPELVKQLLEQGYSLRRPEVIAVWLSGAPVPGVGPQDIALSLVAAVFPNGFVKNKILEFIGPGVAGLSQDFRDGIDVMTTETACLSSVWQTDETVRRTLSRLGRGDAFAALSPQDGALYDGAVYLDLSKVRPMIALPFHPSNAFTIEEFLQNAPDILDKTALDAARTWELDAESCRRALRAALRGGAFYAEQGVVAGCSGGLAQNIRAMARILDGYGASADAFSLSVYPASQPMALALTRDGTLPLLMAAGASVRSAFCGPCFGAGDVPANGGFSIRHSTRNFPNREGSKPAEGQTAYVALMDARSIAATARNGGRLTAATQLALQSEDFPEPEFDISPYRARVTVAVGKPDASVPLRMGPNITDWPAIPALEEDLKMTVACAIFDSVTTTDELIPSGDASSYRSNPLRLARMTLSRRDPAYVGRCDEIGYGSVVCALRPGDGSAREQAASCQRVLGGVANIALEYATKRYCSNLINWGMLPLLWEDLETARPAPGDTFTIPDARRKILEGAQELPAVWSRGGKSEEILFRLPPLSGEDREILAAGCLMNYYKEKLQKAD